ncbi:MAG: DNA adenine methylase [Desulfovibrionaceae bacterium]|nr:DNA adenine methylase [Desulfovibrionaceae bacterium]
MKKIFLAAPVVKWVGGKRQLLDSLLPLFPKKFTTYYEPFVGGGAVLFEIQPQNAVINDINHELISMYEVIRDNVEELISLLSEYKNDSEMYYSVRDWDRNKIFYSSLTKEQKASRIIYLNKTCYNGLFRVNSSGEFNSPFGHYKNPNIVNATVLRAVSNYFNEANIIFVNSDYSHILKSARKGAFVYLDPPYDPVSSTANFTGYTRGGFEKEEQIRLRECCDELDKKGIKFMLSNSATDFIMEQYSKYNISIVTAKRSINSIASKRGAVEEVVVRNYV